MASCTGATDSPPSLLLQKTAFALTISPGTAGEGADQNDGRLVLHDGRPQRSHARQFESDDGTIVVEPGEIFLGLSYDELKDAAPASARGPSSAEGISLRSVAERACPQAGNLNYSGDPQITSRQWLDHWRDCSSHSLMRSARFARSCDCRALRDFMVVFFRERA